MIAAGEIAGVILAGGQSQRMGAEKALQRLGGSSLLAHVIARFQPQVDRLFLNANGDARRFAAFGLDVVPDGDPALPGGPLAGVAAALAKADRLGFKALACAPCDTPFLPLDCVARLRAVQERSGALVAVARSPRGLEPMFALWTVAALAPLQAALARGRPTPRKLLAELGAGEALFDSAGEPDPFANLNTPAELSAAAKFAL